MNMTKYYSQLVGAKIVGFKFDKDESFGPFYSTGAYALILALDEGRLKYLSGIYTKKKGSKSGGGLFK